MWSWARPLAMRPGEEPRRSAEARQFPPRSSRADCPSLQRRQHGVAHLARADGAAALMHDVAGADAAVERLAHRALEPRRRLGLAEAQPQRHREAQDRAQRIGDALPAMSGALPCTGSKNAGRWPSGPGGPKEAEGSMPSEPVAIAAASDRMSPNMLSVSSTSNCAGARTICMAQLSTSMWLRSTSANSASCSAWTSCRHSWPASITLALSTEVTRRRRVRANSKPKRATRRISELV